VEDKKLKWGEASPMFQSRVLGDFPDDDDQALVPLSWVVNANNLWEAIQEENAWSGHIVDAIDVARFGADSTVRARARRQGIQEIERWPKQSTTVTAAAASRLVAGGTSEIRIDADGLGAGVFDQLCDRHGKMPDDDDAGVFAWNKNGIIRGMRGGKSPLIDPDDRYLNRRAEWHWGLRELLDPETPGQCALPPDSELQGQLTTLRWEYAQRGKIKILSKDQMKRAGLKSPDASDAVVYAMAQLPSHTTSIDRMKALTRL